MRKFIYSVTAVLTVTFCTAQISLTQAEYFWDTDPGLGLATAVQATDGTFNSAFEQLTKTGITAPSVGLHKFCIRVKDNTGVWGPVFINIINVQQVTTPSIMALAQAEYFWDTDPGLGLGTPVLATDGSFNSTFEQLARTGIALPAVGLHVFNIRVKDNTGQWGPVFRNVVSVQTTLGAADFDLKKIVVYPNPAKDVLTIDADSVAANVSVYNLLGQQIIAKSISANENTIDVSNLAAGTYFVKIDLGSQVKTVKIIKQ